MEDWQQAILTFVAIGFGAVLTAILSEMTRRWEAKRSKPVIKLDYRVFPVARDGDLIRGKISKELGLLVKNVGGVTARNIKIRLNLEYGSFLVSNTEEDRWSRGVAVPDLNPGESNYVQIGLYDAVDGVFYTGLVTSEQDAFHMIIGQVGVVAKAFAENTQMVVGDFWFSSSLVRSSFFGKIGIPRPTACKPPPRK